VLEFAASLRPEFKVGQGRTKRVLKAAFEKTLPYEILHRKKAGFPVPYANWLRHGLREPVADILLSDRATARGYFKKDEIRQLLEANTSGGQFSKEIFSLLVLELWNQRFLDRSGEDNALDTPLPCEKRQTAVQPQLTLYAPRF
jgi:asparagine synthase (glutamine-hydrolysing)